MLPSDHIFYQHIAIALETAILLIDQNLVVIDSNPFVKQLIAIDENDIGKQLAGLPNIHHSVVAALQLAVENKQQHSQWEFRGINEESLSATVHPTSTTTGGWMFIVNIKKNDPKRIVLLSQMMREVENQGIQVLKQQQQSITEIQQQQDLLQSILANMPEAVLVVNNHGSFELCNAAAKQMSEFFQKGIRLIDWIQANDFYVPSDIKPTEIELSDEQNPFLKSLKGYRVARLELYIKPKNRQKSGYHIALSIQPLQSQQIGLDDGCLIIINHISDRKQAEMELADSERRHRALLHTLPDTLFRVRADGTYLDYIPALNDLIPGATYIDNNVMNILPHEVAQDLMTAITTCLEQQSLQVFKFEYPIDDNNTYYEVRLSPINDQEVMGIARNITDIVMAEYTYENSANNYRALLENMPNPIVLVQQDGTIIWFNQHLRQFLLLDDNSKLTIYDFIQTADVLRAKTALQQCYMGETKQACSFTLQNNNKKKRVSATATPIFYQQEILVQITLTPHRNKS